MRKYFSIVNIALLSLVLAIPVSVLAVQDVVVSEQIYVYISNPGKTFTISPATVDQIQVTDTTVIITMSAGGDAVTVTASDLCCPSIVSGITDPGSNCVGNVCTLTIPSQSSAVDVTLRPSGGFCGFVASSGGVALEDTTAPLVSNLEAQVGSDQATISWQTNEASLSWIVFGTSTDYGREVKTTSYVTSHSLSLTGLSPFTIYHYQIKTKDESGNVGSYIDRIFTTLVSTEAPEELVEDVTEEEIVVPEVTFEKAIQEMSVEEIQTKIAEVLDVIATLQTLLTEIQSKTKVFTGIPVDFHFDKNLSYGETSDEIEYLQIILKEDVGSPTYPDYVPATGWFGPITEDSVIVFQEKYAQDILTPWELTEGTGFVGSTTRAKLNELLGTQE